MPALNDMKISEGHQLLFLAILRTLLYDLAQICAKNYFSHYFGGFSIQCAECKFIKLDIFCTLHFHFVCCHPSFVRGSAAAKMH